MVCRWSSLWSSPCGLWSVETPPAPYTGLSANAWILVGKRACVLMFPNSGGQLGVQYNCTKEPVCDRSCRGFRFSHGPVLRCCCGAVAYGLRWCCCSVPVDGLVGGPVADLVGDLQSVVQSVRWVIPVCPVRSVVQSVVRSLIPSAIRSVVWSLCGLWSGRNMSCSILCCGGAAVPLQCCCGGVAVVLRWSGQWSQSMVRSVVRSVVRSGVLAVPSVVWSLIWSASRSVIWSVSGRWSGPWSGRWTSLVRGLVGGRSGRWCSLWSGPCSLWSRRNTSCFIHHTMAGRLQMPGHRSRKRAFPRRGFRVSHGLVLRCCCSVAEGLRWCCGGVAVVRSVVPVDGALGGPVGGMVRWSGQWPVGGLVCGLVNGPVIGLVRAVCGPSRHVLLHRMACQLQMLGYWSQGACVLL